MRKHNGMRPQDVAILLKMAATEKEWLLSELASELHISVSEISESLNRSMIAGLVDYKKKRVNRGNLMEFMEHGLKYVFPRQAAGGITRGIPTAHSHPFMKKTFGDAEVEYVWPDSKGEILGVLIEPFYSKQVEAVRQDEQFHKLLALADVLRTGRIREINYALVELKKVILHEPSYQ